MRWVLPPCPVGKIIAVTDTEWKRLGDIVLQKAVIFQQLPGAPLGGSAKSGSRLDDGLVALEYAKRETVRERIRNQIREAGVALFLCVGGGL
jgi:hypothetical protein